MGEAFEKAVTLLGDQYGFSDAEGHACYVQRGKVPVATGLKIRTEFQDQVEALTGEFEEEMLEMYQEDYGTFRNEFCVKKTKMCKAADPQLDAAPFTTLSY